MITEALKTKALEALNEILNTAISVKDFAVKEAPSVIQQLLTYNFWSSFIPWLLFLLISTALLIFGITVLVKKPWKEVSSRYSHAEHEEIDITDYSDSYMVATSALLLWLLITVILFTDGLNRSCWMKIAIAPKVYLIEYAAGLVK